MHNLKLLQKDYKTLNADNTTTPSISDVIESIKEDDKTEFIIQNGELLYIGLDENKKEWVEEIGLKTQLPDNPLTEEGYKKIYENEIAIALKYGQVIDNVYYLKDEYLPWRNGWNEVKVLPSEVTKLAVPYGVTTVGWAAFKSKHLNTVILPETVIAIDGEAFFLGACEALININFPNNLKSIGFNAFTGTALSGDIVLPPNLISIGSGAFESTNITSINIPKLVTKLEGATFRNSKLNTIIIPKSITEMRTSDFENTTKDLTVYYEGTVEDWKEITIIEDSQYNPLIDANIIYNYAY